MAALEYTPVFFVRITFLSNVRLKLTKNQANSRQNPEVLKIIHIVHPRYHPKVIGYIVK